jgi:serine/threonine protein kinase
LFCINSKDQEYLVGHRSFYKALHANKTSHLALFVIKMAQALDLLQDKFLVHGDINSHNIMVHIEDGTLQGIKLVDFGSSFEFNEKMRI